MNIFILTLLFFAAVGLIDKIQGNKWGLAREFDNGLLTMGTITMPVTGIYCVGITLIKHYAGAISGWTQGLPIDPSIIIGCLLAPDLGAPFLTVELTENLNLAYFSGVVVAGCLGQFISFQLPVLLSTQEEKEKPSMMKGFLQGLIAIPFGLMTGGVLIGLSLKEILINMSLISVVCFILGVAFIKAALIVERTLIAFGNAIAFGSYIMFAVVVFGLFFPQWKAVDDGLVHEILIILIKMIIIICGGMVLSNVCIRYFKHQLSWIAKKMNTNDAAVMGLILNCISSLPMTALIPEMDENGKKINTAFAVSGAYLLGGQMVFISSIGNKTVFWAYFFSKLTAGIVSVAISMRTARKKEHF
jgi:ethanolamine transporter